MRRPEQYWDTHIHLEQYGDQALSEFTLLVQQLNETVRKINNGEGTAGKLIADPSVYESINDILIGINESKLLRWLIRNRQQSGIEKRYDEQKTGAPVIPGKKVETVPAAPASDVPPDAKSIVTPPAAVFPPAVPPTVTTTSSDVPPPPVTTTTAATSTQQ